VGDVPIPGAGLFAGPRGAVAATGTGERIIEAHMARSVYDLLTRGDAADAALKDTLERHADIDSVGLIAIDANRMAAHASQPMAWAAREQGSNTWQGPAPSAAPAPAQTE
jgi:isoaspartyl peptidase/L-asparaginase-like protein (Ntn-hydrolase superfamily)